MAGVQVLLIDPKEADDFLTTKTAEAKEETKRLSAELSKLESEKQAALAECEQTKSNVTAYLQSETFQNDARLPLLQAELDKCNEAIKKLTATLLYLSAKYGEPPDPAGPNLPVRRHSKEQNDAWVAENYDDETIRSLNQKVRQIEREMDSAKKMLCAEQAGKIRIAESKAQRVATEIADAQISLREVTLPAFYLDDFNPKPIEIALTDNKGNFILNQSKRPAKLFAKFKLGDVNLFWLLDAPMKGEKAILNNNNVFKVHIQQ